MPGIWTPLLETMSAAARVAWPHITAAVERGLEGEQVIEVLREGGIPTFRRQDMLALIREASGARLLKSDISRWPADTLLPINRVRESVTKIVAPFSYTLRVRVADVETGEERTITRQAHSEQLRAAEDVVGAFMAQAGTSDNYSAMEVLDAEVVDVQRSGAAGVI